jgi:pimeloyl-ACP methyl ester carboxylesterase
MPVDLSKHSKPVCAHKVTFVASDEVSMPDYYMRRGTDCLPGRPLVLLHGISRNAAELATRFATATQWDGWTLIAPVFEKDRFGQFQQMLAAESEVPSDQALIALIERVFDDAGRDPGPVHLFGFSGGAQLAHRFAMLHPHLTAAVYAMAAGWYLLRRHSVQARWPLCRDHHRHHYRRDPALRCRWRRDHRCHLRQRRHHHRQRPQLLRCWLHCRHHCRHHRRHRRWLLILPDRRHCRHRHRNHWQRHHPARQPCDANATQRQQCASSRGSNGNSPQRLAIMSNGQTPITYAAPSGTSASSRRSADRLPRNAGWRLCRRLLDESEADRP